MYTRYPTANPLNNSTISGYSAAVGGGVYSFGAMTLTNSAISSNSASVEGGGITNTGFSPLTLVRTLVSGNTAPTCRSERGDEHIRRLQPLWPQ